MRFRALSILIFMFMVGMSQQLKVVNATYTYYAPLSQTIEEAKITALERAQIQAIADEFGTIVTQSNSTSVANGKVDFLSVGGSEVKGEWIETLSEPVYEISYNKNFLIVSVETKGRIREIIQIPVDLKVEILRNSTDRKMISTNFKNQDIFYLYFSAPIDGWLTVSMSKI